MNNAFLTKKCASEGSQVNLKMLQIKCYK